MSLRVALVGLGEIGVGAHLPALQRSPDVEIAALVDVSADRRAAVAGLAPVVADLADVAGLDAVVLATPPWVTPELTVSALRDGLFVLAEKPVATSMAAAAVYDGLTDAERNRLQIGLTYRHDPALVELHDWIAAGRLGAPLLVRAHIYDERRNPADPAHYDRIVTTLRHGLPVVHEGAHVIDWLAYLLDGLPTSIDDAWALRTDEAYPGPNVTGARLGHAAGHTVLLEFGWLTDALPRCEISLLGPRGHAVLDGATFRLQLSTVDHTTVVEPAGDRTERCFDLQLARFVDLIGGRSGPTPNLADGIAALDVCERIAAAAKEAGR